MSKDIVVEYVDSHVAVVELARPPNNFFDFELIREVADAYEALCDDGRCRAIVLAAKGKHFCAGANFGSRESWGDEQLDSQARRLYVEAVRLFRAKTPVVAAVHGAAIGGGLGLALSADFRVTCEAARFSANFSSLGFHHGFGLSVTLPRLVGPAKAELLLLTSRRLKGKEAFELGLADELVSAEHVRARAISLAGEIAAAGPLAVRAIRETMRGELEQAVTRATERELSEQSRLRRTEDFHEGIAASAERRAPRFHGR